MGCIEYSNLIVKAPKDKESLIKQLMSCIGVSFDKYCGTEDEIDNELLIVPGERPYSPDYLLVAGNKDDMVIDIGPAYVLINRLFGNTIVCAESGFENSSSYYEDRLEKIFNPYSQKQITNDIEYDLDNFCIRDGEDPMEYVEWEKYREEIEEMAREEEVEISWDESEDRLKPNEDEDDFMDLCREYVDSEIGLKKLGTIVTERDITNEDITTWKKELIGAMNEIKDNASNNGFSELLIMLEKVK